jgi:hypothetical protein
MAVPAPLPRPGALSETLTFGFTAFSGCVANSIGTEVFSNSRRDTAEGVDEFAPSGRVTFR